MYCFSCAADAAQTTADVLVDEGTVSSFVFRSSVCLSLVGLPVVKRLRVDFREICAVWTWTG